MHRLSNPEYPEDPRLSGCYATVSFESPLREALRPGELIRWLLALPRSLHRSLHRSLLALEHQQHGHQLSEAPFDSNAGPISTQPVIVSNYPLYTRVSDLLS